MINNLSINMKICFYPRLIVSLFDHQQIYSMINNIDFININYQP